jgi:small nuclear ribonucleoprotein (snRNP)-like protein
LPEACLQEQVLSLVLLGAVALNANRQVTGVLRGFDQFMNIVLDNTVDEKSHTDIGMVVSI